MELNIYQRLYEIRKRIEYIQKDTKGHRYSYANETAVLTTIRPLLDEFRLLLEVEMGEPVRFSDEVLQTSINFTFVNVDNPSEQIHKKIFLQDTIGDPKKLGGLLTYGVRFFLVKYFNIPTDEADPDSFQNEHYNKLTQEQINTLKSKLKDYKDLETRLLKWANISNIEDLKVEQYSVALKTIHDHIAKEKTNAKNPA